MQASADRGREDVAARASDAVARADALLSAALAILDAEGLDRAGAFAEMARQALADAVQASLERL